MLKTTNCRSSFILPAAALLLLTAGISGVGQTPTPSPTPAATQEKQDTKPEPVNYLMPDLAEGVTTFKNKAFTVRIGFAILADYTLVSQNATSRSQVGPQASIFDLRAGRLVFAGQLNFKRPWKYVISGDYDEHRNRGDKVFDVLDMYLTIPLWKKARVTLGKQKEPFIYEMVGDAANLPQQERVLNAFFVSRNIGIRYLDNYLNDRISFSVGVYNDWFRSGMKYRESGYQVSGRLTGLPLESRDKRTFLHLGAGFRYNGADKGQMRFRVRPETNALDYYVDTGKLPATHAKQLSFEALYNKRAFSVLAEYTQAWVEAPTKGNPSFNGSYVTVSYVLTGENRPYDKSVGYARRIIPRSRWGAVEVVGRFGYVDLNDGVVRGGQLKTWYVGMNWWASRQWKLGTGYGIADLDRFNTSGLTQRWFSRLQWIY